MIGNENGGPGGDGGPDRGPLLTPRNLTILVVAGVSTQSAVPAIVPAIEAGTPSSLLALLAAIALLDRIVA